MEFRPYLPGPDDNASWYHLDWSSPRSLRRNRHMLTVEQRWYLRQIDERAKEFPEFFADNDYRTLASMIAMACARRSAWDRDASADLPFKDRFLRCRTLPTKYHSRGTCGVRRFCPYCNYILRREALLTYVPAFDQGQWYFMTISASPLLNLDLDELTFSWDAGKAVVEALLEAGLFQGAYWTEEVSLHSLFPDILVHPHNHVILHAEAEADMVRAQALAERTFRRYFAALERKAVRDGQHDSLTLLEPSIELKVLTTQRDLYRACDYLTKTMGSGRRTETVGIVDVYRNALDEVGDEERWRVNVEFEQFLAGMMLMLEEDSRPRKVKKRKRSATTSGTAPEDEQPRTSRPRSRIQRHRLGTLKSGRNHRFVGVRPEQRREHLHEIEELRRATIAERATSGHDDDQIDVEQ